MDTKYKKIRGNEGETLVAEHYQHQGYTLIEQNYTIPGGELDLIFQKKNILTFVEVKVVDHLEELHDYVTPKKLGTVRRTIDYYILEHPTDKEYILDVVFVKDNSILYAYENVTNT